MAQKEMGRHPQNSLLPMRCSLQISTESYRLNMNITDLRNVLKKISKGVSSLKYSNLISVRS